MNRKFKKILAIALCLSLTLGMSSFIFAEETAETTAETVQTPPERPMGETPPEMPADDIPPEKPMGEMQEGFKPGMPRANDPGMGNNRFADVEPDSWYAEYVSFVSMRGIMSGKDGSFNPLNATSRAEYVLALYNAAGAPEVSENSSFSDVAADTEYAKAIAWAEANGIATGTGDGTFTPDGSLTREMAMTFLYRALSALNITADVPADSMLSDFSDNSSVSSWAGEAMNTLVNMGIISGTDEGNLNPQGSLVNAEVAAMIYRLLGGDEMRKNSSKDAPEMTEEEKASMLEQMTADLNEKLESGEITQEEYDEMLDKIESGVFMPGGMKNGKGENPPAIPEEIPEENAEITENGY